MRSPDNLLQHPRKRRQERAFAELDRGSCFLGGVRGGDQTGANGLGERANQGRDLLFQVAGHEPIDFGMRDLIDGMARDGHRHAVLILSGRKAVLQWKADLVDRQRIRILG